LVLRPPPGIPQGTLQSERGYLGSVVLVWRAGDSSRVNRRGKSGSCPVSWRPGVAASTEILPSKAGWKRRTGKLLRRKSQGEHREMVRSQAPHLRRFFRSAKDGSRKYPRLRCGSGGWPGPHLFGAGFRSQVSAVRSSNSSAHATSQPPAGRWHSVPFLQTTFARDRAATGVWGATRRPDLDAARRLFHLIQNTCISLRGSRSKALVSHMHFCQLKKFD